MVCTVIPAAQARLTDFLAGLPATDDRVAGPIERALAGPPRWLFVSLPTGSGKTLFLGSRCLVSGVGETFLSEPTVTSARAIHRTLAAALGQRRQSVAWVGYGAGGEVAYTARTRLKVMTTGHCISRLIRLAAANGQGPAPAHVVLDEMHHPSADNWVAFQLLKHLTVELKAPIHVTVASATLDRARLDIGGFPSATVVELPDDHPAARLHPIAEHFDRGDPPYHAAVAWCHRKVREALRDHPGSSGIVFVAGEECVHAMCAQLAGGDADVVGVWSGMPSEALETVFAPADRRRVYVCTNVAETGITLPDADWVCDSGYCKVVVPSSTPGGQALLLRRTTRASAKQRAGRVGRCRPGSVYRAYGPEVKLDEHGPNEFEAVPPYGHCLRLLDAGVGLEVLGMPAGRQADVVAELARLGLVRGAAVTPLGRRAATVPAAVPIAAALVRAADAFEPGPTLLAACAFLAASEAGGLARLLWVPVASRRGADFAAYFHDHFAAWARRDDLEALVRLLFAAPRDRSFKQWCRRSSLNDHTARAVLTLADALVYHGFYCPWASVRKVWARHAAAADSVDYEALRGWVHNSFAARALRYKGEDHRGGLYFTDARGKEWALDSKRRLFTFHQQAKPTSVVAMSLFESDTARGKSTALASCIVAPPITQTPPATPI